MVRRILYNYVEAEPSSAGIVEPSMAGKKQL